MLISVAGAATRAWSCHVLVLISTTMWLFRKISAASGMSQQACEGGGKIQVFPSLASDLCY